MEPTRIRERTKGLDDRRICTGQIFGMGARRSDYGRAGRVFGATAVRRPGVAAHQHNAFLAAMYLPGPGTYRP